MRVFKDIEVGDEVIVFDSESSHDYIEHVLKVTSIEYDKEFATESNPEGMHCYGDELECDENDEESLTQIYESNFVCFASDSERLEIRKA